MTEEQINIAIAESLGWKREFNGDHEEPEWYWISPNDPDGHADGSPNYHSSLDACAEFEAALKDDKRMVYGYLLCELVLATLEEPPDFDISELTRGHWAGIVELSRVVSATAPQRCQAYLRAIEKWEASA